MEFYLLDVKSTVNINGVDVAFDYINTYYDCDKAIKEAEQLSIKKGVIDVSAHRWILKDDGTQRHAEGDHAIPYHFNREQIKGVAF